MDKGQPKTMRTQLRLLVLGIWLTTASLFSDTGGGGGAGGEGSEGSDNGGEGGGGDGNDGAKFTQDDMNREATKRAERAARSERAKIAEELGVPLEEVGEILKQRKEEDDKNMSESQKALAQAEAARTEATREAAAAKSERTLARTERLLGSAGMPADAIETYAPVILGGLDADADADDIKAAIEKFKEGHGAPLFGATQDAGKPPPGHSGGRKHGKGGKGAATSFEAGAELAAKRFGKENANT